MRGGIAGLAVRSGSIIAGLIASVTLARLLGPETYGVYAFVFSLITLIGLPVKMGLPTLILRETARADQADDGALMRGIWRWSDRAMALMAAVVLGLTGLYLWLISGIETPHMAALLWALPLVPLIGWAQARSAAIRGLRRVALGAAPDKVVRPLLLAAAVVLAAWTLSAPLSAAQVFAIHAGVAAIALLFASVILKRVAPRHVAAETPRTQPRAWIAAILPLAAIAGLQEISHNTDILMLGALASDADVGLYRVALSGANIALFGLTTANLVLQPYFARAWGAGDHRALQRLATVGARISVLSTLPILGLFWFGGIWLLGLIFGDAYAGAFWALILLCIGQSFSAFFGSVGSLLTMSGREWVALSGLGVSTLVNVGLNWLLIPIYGIEGAAFATGLSMIAWNVGLWGATWILLRIDSSALGLRRTPPASLGPRAGS
ncbi:Membrane protein involved in the export of O-antigen and teichoic acid [Roseivivax halotolerans]|uniref:Membrane protein involved in the export of O-antigen and teichoic acid n=1 Tax=Roseivivax halotolerans TaxID=93684 RepID=A0A1I6A294_9RHOB|nr:oligosaccharide flippase family protein [Roseivivax halotolerans]SFQ62856.1 Membrane protein involved in the export of O-antigen and teichoic acid [Roseivivax halotolerans]